jgi:alanine racemase
LTAITSNWDKLAKHTEAECAAVVKGNATAADLLKRAKRERRRIAAFSQFDKNLSLDELGVDLSPVYADARLIAVKWLNAMTSQE